MSLDGYTSGPDEQLDWLAPHITPQAHAYFRKLRERSDTILVGRVNYEGYVSYWPKVKDDPNASRDEVDISRWLDEVKKVVFSRTLHEVTWKNAVLAKVGPVEEVAALKRVPGQDIIIHEAIRRGPFRSRSHRPALTASSPRRRRSHVEGAAPAPLGPPRESCRRIGRDDGSWG
jgi:dihydrofolate reductase